ncbi:YphA family membrane protein [Alkalicoccobacillus plakortidis]|uniref:Uncharacterized protein n=1 Tax=Alkalicoccobacillus plakortidis TaxID=444060 RepID=A0ABT0XGJ8_9BACI|nr:hypothetical protein [Alkalicoccobacillus plakortidis]MCM2674322.1 hypothetical protein [Alkalicoccobacillus plakortidis]
MEGLVMFWLGWTAWVVVTFLVPKTSNRYGFALFILLFIIFYSININMLSGSINLGFIWLTVSCYWFFHRQTKRNLISSFFWVWVITAIYAGFTLWSIFDPIILIANKEWMVAGLLYVVSSLLIKSTYVRLIAVTLGIMHGELLLNLVLSKIWGTYEVGSGLFFDGLAASLLILFVHLLLQNTLRFLRRLTENSSQATQSL